MAGDLSGAVLDGVWSAEDTSPAAIEGALRDLLMQRAAEGAQYAPARVVNLLAVVDARFRGEIVNRLEGVGRYHPSRTVICAVEPGRTTLDAWATMACVVESDPGSLALCRERVEIDVGPGHLRDLHTILDAVVVPDLTTIVWAPHGHAEAVDALLNLAQVVLLDSVDAPDLRDAMARATDLSERAYVVDLAWLRSTPWRERVSATFDPPAWRGELRDISAVTVRHRQDSAAAALLLVGWLASRLGWATAPLVPVDGALEGRASTARGDVRIRLEPVIEQDAPGLAGLALATRGGDVVSLDRGPGGLAARRRTADGRSAAWTVLGASRGEAGILGEGVRQALLRDPTYRPALTAARGMVA